MKLTWQGIVGVVAGAAVLGVVVAGGAYVGRTVAERKATEVPAPAPSVAAPAPPTPAPVTAGPSAGPSTSPSVNPSPTRSAAPRSSAPRTLLNLQGILPQVTLRIPAGAGCPAATVRFDAAGGGRGGEYRMTDEPGADYGDLTGDGHEELFLPVVCRNAPGTLLVIAATGPATYAVRAALTRPADIARTEIRGQRLRLYGAAGRLLAAYRLTGDQLVRTTS